MRVRGPLARAGLQVSVPFHWVQLVGASIIIISGLTRLNNWALLNAQGLGVEPCNTIKWRVLEPRRLSRGAKALD